VASKPSRAIRNLDDKDIEAFLLGPFVFGGPVISMPIFSLTHHSGKGEARQHIHRSLDFGLADNACDANGPIDILEGQCIDGLGRRKLLSSKDGPPPAIGTAGKQGLRRSRFV